MLIFKFLLLFGILGVSCDSVCAYSDTEHPKVILSNSVFFTHDTVIEENNGTTYHVPVTFKELEFTCISSYPTEWKFTQAPHKDEKLKEIKITKFRSSEYINSSIFTFESKLLLKFKFPTFVQNLTCRGVKRYELQHLNTSIVTFNDDDVCNITVHILSGIDTAEILKNRGREGLNIDCNLTLHIDLKLKEYTCTSSNPYQTKSKIFDCKSSDECNAIFKSDKHICNNSVILSCKSTKCKKLNPSIHPAIIVCDSGLASLARRYYTTKTFGSGNKELVLHLDKTNFEIDEIMHLKTDSEDIFEDQNATFTCEGMDWYFSHGFRWALKTNDEQLLDIGPGYEEVNESTHTYVERKTISFRKNESGLYVAVFCFGPLWNSYDWANYSLEINVQTPVAPTISESTVIDSNNNATTYRCDVAGLPQPTFEWRLNTNTVLSPATQTDLFKITNEFNFTQLTIFKLYTADLMCIGRNCVGTANHTFHHNRKRAAREKEAREENNLLIHVVIGSVSAVAICLLILLGTCHVVRKQRLKLQQLSDAEINEFQKGNPESTNALFLPYNIEYEIPCEKLLIEDIVLGEGQFAEVRTGRLGSSNVAVKTVKRTADVIYFKALLSELKILCYVGEHPHVVSLIGACTKNIRQREVFVVIEYCHNGSMLQILRNSRNFFVDRLRNDDYIADRKSIVNYENANVKQLSTRDLAQWACEIASGMEFLTSKNVIHGDLAARNILITDAFHAKVGDFGLSKQLFEYSVYIQKLQCPLPLKWMALESLQDLEFSLQSDVWSYGVTVWEIYSLGQTPYPGHPQWDFESYKLLKNGYRMEKPDYASEIVYQIMLRCWESNPKDRPAFKVLKDDFEEIRNSR